MTGGAPYIDIHTHRTSTEPGTIAVVNVFAQDIAYPPPGQLVSAGLHPWHVEQIADIDACLSNLFNFCESNKNVFAIGEIGLDRRRDNWQPQYQAFKQQLLIAQELGLPVVVHCVRAYPDVLACLRELSITIPVIFHGFSASIHTIRQLLDAGAYFSLGERSFRSQPATLHLLPSDRILLETDESALPIKEIYDIYSGITCKRNCTVRQEVWTTFNGIARK